MHLASSVDGTAGTASGPASYADGDEQCRFPKLEECAHFHYERVHLPPMAVCLQTNMERSLHSQHSQEDDCEWFMVQVTSGDECWLLQRNYENFRLLDSQLHQCIYDRKISQLPDLSLAAPPLEDALGAYLRRFTTVADNSINCGPVLNWLQMDNKGHRLLVPSEESRSINTPAVAAAYSVRRYVSQARDELNLEVGDMISVIDMASPGESIWWRGKRGFQVGFFPQHCVHIIGDKVPRNMPLPAPVVGSLALSPIKPVLRKHGKLIAFFRSFILNRPSRRRLKQSGILRERVFGCDLGEHLLNSGCEIPTVLKCCAEFIETHGIVDGIYRLSGVTSNIQKLRNAFDEDRIPNLYTEDILQDIHSVASLLKMYFRELPNPLCTYQLYQSFVQAVQGCTTSRNTKQDHERLLKMREAVQKLPPPHYRTLEYLARHLAKVAKHGERTGMTVRNVAIVWAPNLLRCAELEVGGVAALQGVGVQAVVTEFLICYAELIFCDNLKLNMSDLHVATSPKRSRPKSLAISTPTKLITLEEARNKHYKEAYIEVGGGPDTLPKKYHTIIELPSRKRVNSKRSPLGWRSLFGKSRNSRTTKPTIVHHVVDVDATDAAAVAPDVKIVLRTVKSAESLSDLDQLPPLQNILSTKPAGHNRSVSHDSYFDTLQSSQEGSLLDLSEIQVNFDLEESEMRIFSEDESLVSSPRVQPRRIRINSGNNSGNPSPKKQPRVLVSPEAASRKRTRLEEQLGDIQFIDCNTPEIGGSTIVQVHSQSHSQRHEEVEGPRNKSPRNSQCYTPPSPGYKLLESTGTSPGELECCAATPKTPTPPTYENVLTTISITYKSPTKEKSFAALNDTDDECEAPPYEVITVATEEAQIPTSTASLPMQAAKTLVEDPMAKSSRNSTTSITNSLSADEPEVEASAKSDEPTNDEEDSFPKCDTTLSELIDSYDRIAKATSGDWSHISLLDEQDPSTDNLEHNLEHSYENVKTCSSSSEESTSNSLANYENIHFDMMQSSSDMDVLAPPVADLIEFSPVEEAPNNEKRKQSPHTSEHDADVYQQVKYFRRSVHEINELLALNDEDAASDELEVPEVSLNSYENVIAEEDVAKVIEIIEPVEINQEPGVDTNPEVVPEPPEQEVENYDSLETCDYEPIEFANDSLETFGTSGSSGEAPEVQVQIKTDVIDIAQLDDNDISMTVTLTTTKTPKSVKLLTSKFEVQDTTGAGRPLPPCVRARNLKSAIKTRSLDETEFTKRAVVTSPTAAAAAHIDGEPGTQRRKSLDENMCGYKMNTLPKTLNKPKQLPDDPEMGLHVVPHDVNLNRERIEKYKEERRKFLHDKYRSESFKEHKDVLLSRFKVFKPPVSEPVQAAEVKEVVCAPSPLPVPVVVVNAGGNTANGVKAKTALFEPEVEMRHGSVSSRRHKAESSFEAARRSFEKPSRKETTSYCIKDMKAIFESKSQQ